MAGCRNGLKATPTHSRVNRLNRRIILGHLLIVRNLEGYVKAGALNAIIPDT